VLASHGRRCERTYDLGHMLENVEECRVQEETDGRKELEMLTTYDFNS
jgi:hypothetical protein